MFGERAQERLVGRRVSHAKIVDGIESVLLDETVYRRMARAHNPYGDGRAADRISRILQAWARGDDAPPDAEFVPQGGTGDRALETTL